MAQVNRFSFSRVSRGVDLGESLDSDRRRLRRGGMRLVGTHGPGRGSLDESQLVRVGEGNGLGRLAERRPRKIRLGRLRKKIVLDDHDVDVGLREIGRLILRQRKVANRPSRGALRHRGRGGAPDVDHRVDAPLQIDSVCTILAMRCAVRSWKEQAV